MLLAEGIQVHWCGYRVRVPCRSRACSRNYSPVAAGYENRKELSITDEPLPLIDGVARAD
jgi:hypothetical protein